MSRFRLPASWRRGLPNPGPQMCAAGRSLTQPAERAHDELAAGPADEDAAWAAASPPGEDLDGPAAFVIDALAGHDGSVDYVSLWSMTSRSMLNSANTSLRMPTSASVACTWAEASLGSA